MNKPEFVQVTVDAVDGGMLCSYVAEQFGIQSDEVYDIIAEHVYNHGDVDMHQHLLELIIEEEDYCNDKGEYYEVLQFIAEEFGGHFNINFLSICAYL